jgi:tetratricopeptide (TPR) repeat protein
MRPALASTLLLCACQLASAAEQWVKFKSSHFELYTTAGEKKGREAILYFEQVDDFFSKVLAKSKSVAPRPVRIIAFRTEKEYKPFRPNESAAAFYLGGYDRDYIVMQGIASENYPVAVHEFTHLLVRHSGAEVPIWFNEGLAELYSTMKPVGKKVQIGDLKVGHLQALHENKWLPLEALVSVDSNSPYYNERNRAGVFYAESWALTHMLNLSPQYRPQFSKFVSLLASGLPATNAFWQAYAKTLAQVQKDLELYLRGTSFNAVLFDIKLQKSDEDPDIEPASPLESGMVLADLLAFTNKNDEAKQKYEGLAKEFPQSWEVEAGLAELAWREKDLDAARRHFARAAELGSTNPRIYYDYAMILRTDGENGASSIPALKKAVELDPDYQDAHHYLAFCLLQAENFQDAVEHFNKVKKVKGDQAFAFYHGLAYANYRLEKRDAARIAAQAARKAANTPDQITAADEMLRALSEPPSVVQRGVVVDRPVERTQLAERKAPAPRPVREEPDEEKPKRLVRRAEPPEAPAAPPETQHLSIEGTLQHVDCLGKVARLRVLVGRKPVLVAIANPQSVTVKGSPTGTLDLTCGPQKLKSIRLEYESRPDTKLGTVGVVRSIEFR